MLLELDVWKDRPCWGGRGMRILGTERTEQALSWISSGRSQSREEGHPSAQEQPRGKVEVTSHWGSDKCTQSLPKVCGFKKCFLKSISKVPSLHQPTGISIPKTPICLVSLTQLDSANVGSLHPPSMGRVLASFWRSLLFWGPDTLFMGNNTELGTKCYRQTTTWQFGSASCSPGPMKNDEQALEWKRPFSIWEAEELDILSVYI